MKMSQTFLVVLAASFVFTACGGSSRLKARQDQREKMVSASGLYCEWVNGEKNSDFDVELNMQMAKRCDANRPFSLVPYKNLSDQTGILYCCAVAGSEPPAGNSYAPPIPRRTTGPAVRRVTPSPAGAVAPAQTQPVTGASPAVQVQPPANSGATDLTSDEIVEDK